MTKLASGRITVASQFDAKGVEQAQRALKKFADESRSGMEKFQSSLQKTSKTMSDIGGKMNRNITLPLAAISVAAIKTATDFESSMTRIQSLVGFSADAVAEMNKEVLEMSGRTAQAPKALADALFFATSAGLDTKNALQAVEQAARASAVGLGDVSTIVDLSTSAMNAYGADVVDAAAATDVLTMAVRQGKLEPSQLAGAMGAILPIASAMGVQFHEVGAAFAAMSRTGTDANAASTQLKGILSSILSPSAEAATALAQIGLSSESLQASIRKDGLLATLQMLVDGFDGNAAATSAVFGNIRALSGVMDLLGSNAADTAKVFEELKNAVGVTDEAFDIAAQTAEFQFKQAMADIQSALISLGNVLLPIATKIVSAFAGVVSKFSELGEGTQKVIVIFGLFAAAMGPALLITAKMITTVDVLIKAYKGLRSSAIAAKIATLALKSAMLTVPLLAFAAGALAVFSAFQKSKRSAEDFAEAVKGVREQLNGNSTASEVTRSKVEELIATNAMFAEAMNMAGVSVSQFSDAAENDLEEFNRLQQKITDNLRDNFHGVGDTFGTVGRKGEELAQVVEAEFGVITEAMRLQEEETQRLGDHYDLMSMVVQDDLHAYAEAARQAGNGASTSLEISALRSESAMRSIGEITQLTSALIQDELQKVEQAATDLANGVNSAAQSAANSFLDLSDEGKQSIESFIDEMIFNTARLSVFQNNITSIMGETSGEFANFLMAMGEDAEGLVADLADPANASKLREAFLVFEQQAAIGSKAMTEEFSKVSPEFQKTLEGVGGLTADEMDKIAVVARDKAMEIGTNLMLGQVEGITRNSSEVQQAIRDAVDAGIDAGLRQAGIRSPSRRMANEIGRPMSQGIAVGIEEGSPEIQAAMRRTIQKTLVDAAKELDTRIAGISGSASGSFMSGLIPRPEDLAAITRTVHDISGEIRTSGRAARGAADVFVQNLITSSNKLGGFQDNVLSIAAKTSGEFGLFLLEMGADAEHLVADLADPSKVHLLDQAFAAFIDSTAVTQRDMSAEFAKVDPQFAAILENLSLVIEDEAKPLEDAGRAAGRAVTRGMRNGILAGGPAVLAEAERLRASLTVPTLAVPPTIEFEAGLYGPMMPRVGRGVSPMMPRGFRNGGLVPGSRSMPVPIMAHGGEYVLSADIVNAIRTGVPSRGLDGTSAAAGSGGAMNVTINMPAGVNGDDVVRALQNYQRSHGVLPLPITGAIRT